MKAQSSTILFLSYTIYIYSRALCVATHNERAGRPVVAMLDHCAFQSSKCSFYDKK